MVVVTLVRHQRRDGLTAFNGKTETCDNKQSVCVIKRSSGTKFYAIPMSGETNHEVIVCRESVLGESGGFFFDSLFSDDHQVHTIPAGYVSGHRRSNSPK